MRVGKLIRATASAVLVGMVAGCDFVQSAISLMNQRENEEFLLECMGFAGHPDQFSRSLSAEEALVGERRFVLRIVSANMSEDWRDYTRRPFIVAEHSYAPSPLIAAINACTSKRVCTVTMDADQIAAVVDNENGAQMFRILRASGNYSATLEWRARPELERARESWREQGQGGRLERAF